MIVKGYKSGANFLEASNAISKHLEVSATEARMLCKEIEEGKAVSLSDDFCLREDLEDLGFLL